MKQLFRTLVDQHQQIVYSQAIFILADKGDAEDATQEAYERLWKTMNSATPKNEFDHDKAKAWLLHVVRNLCIDRLRRRKPMVEQDFEEVENQHHQSKPVATLMSKQMSAWLVGAIERLKEPYRTLIILADLQQRSIRDVATTLNLNENQAKVYIHRGRKQLRVLLQGIDL